MHTFNSRNVHTMLPVVLDRLFQVGVSRQTRNGPVLQLEGPSLLKYERPSERVMLWPERDANPFFHLLEAMWMLAGRNDVALPASYARRMLEFSDDGETLNGAYGFRWRVHFGYDQLEWIIDQLTAVPNCRRCVLSMWDAGNPDVDCTGDLYLGFHGSKDVPCNTQAYFSINGRGALDMTVCNRSNDIVWGCCGANAVHFSFLLEYMAGRIGVPVGSYYQFSNNLHGYLATIEPLRGLALKQGEPCHYERFEVVPLAFFDERVDRDLPRFVGDSIPFESQFFSSVVVPMASVYKTHKEGDTAKALERTRYIKAQDWQRAAVEWLERRLRAKQANAV